VPAHAQHVAINIGFILSSSAGLFGMPVFPKQLSGWIPEELCQIGFSEK
jgi:hypothetical protein